MQARTPHPLFLGGDGPWCAAGDCSSNEWRQRKLRCNQCPRRGAGSARGLPGAPGGTGTVFRTTADCPAAGPQQSHQVARGAGGHRSGSSDGNGTHCSGSSTIYRWGVPVGTVGVLVLRSGSSASGQDAVETGGMHLSQLQGWGQVQIKVGFGSLLDCQVFSGKKQVYAIFVVCNRGYFFFSTMMQKSRWQASQEAAHMPHSWLRQGIRQDVPPACPPAMAQWRETLRLQLALLREALHQVGRAAAAPAHAHRGEALPVPRLQQEVHAVRPPQQAHQVRYAEKEEVGKKIRTWKDSSLC